MTFSVTFSSNLDIKKPFFAEIKVSHLGWIQKNTSFRGGGNEKAIKIDLDDENPEIVLK